MSAHLPALMAFARRDAFMVRRDAAVELGNGRVRYDALFSRWGMQDYPGGPEWRPKEEVFAPASLASGANNPGVLLHPAKNYRTNFGDGSHPVRGCTGDRIVPHSDGIHTFGQLIVWDSEWNDQIMSGETAELSVGFSVDPNTEQGTIDDPAAPGVDLYGPNYVAVHRRPIWDHVAGVPEGNAGTARVLLDAAISIHPATREAMALIAAERADARAYYFDLGQWGTRRRAPAQTHQETQRMDHDKIIAKIKAAKTPREIADAMVELKGEQSDPVMQAAIAAMQAMAEAPPEQLTPLGETPPSEAPVAPASEQPAEPAQDGDPDDKMDAALRSYGIDVDVVVGRKLVHDAAARLANALLAGIEAFGVEYRDAAASKTIPEIKREVVAKVDPDRLPKIDKHDGVHKSAALDLHFEECVEILDARRDWGDRILEAVRQAKIDKHDGQTAEVEGPISRREKAKKASASK